MTTPVQSDPAKSDPETLVLRAAPRRAIRFKRKLLIGLAASGAVALFAVTWLGLKGPALRMGPPTQELYNTERKPAPDGLANRDLAAYAGAYRQAYGSEESVADLIPFMLDAFLASDRGFAQARKDRAKEGAVSPQKPRRVRKPDPSPTTSTEG